MTKKQLELITDYYEVQQDLLKLIKKASDIVDKLGDTLSQPRQEYFMIRHDGYAWGKKVYKYVQKRKDWKRPRVTSDMGYCAGCNVIFKSELAAENFLYSFLNSRHRSFDSDKLEWKIVKVSDKVLQNQPLKEYYCREYGYYYV